MITRLTVTWFMEKYRVMATTWLTALYQLAVSLGFSETNLYFENHLLSEQSVKNFLSLMTIISVAWAIPVLIFMKEKPSTPPSYVSCSPREPYIKSLIELSKNKDFILLTMAFSFAHGYE